MTGCRVPSYRTRVGAEKSEQVHLIAHDRHLGLSKKFFVENSLYQLAPQDSCGWHSPDGSSIELQEFWEVGFPFSLFTPVRGRW